MTSSNPSARPLPSARAALAGIAAAALALGTGELVAGLLIGTPSPLVAVGAAVIDLAPPGSKELVVSLFGTNDKPALLILVAAVVLGAGALIGLLARRRPDVASGAIVGLVAVGFLAALRDPATSALLAAASTGLQALVGVQALGWLLGAARTDARPGTAEAAGARRSFLARTGALGVLAIAGGGVGRMLLDGRAAQTAAVDTSIPDTVDPAALPPPDASFDIAGITPLVVPNDAFYRIDTALITPSVDVSSWRLRVHGMVDREITLSFDDLLELPLIERYVTIACVSNEVGGHLVGNAKWAGVRLTDVLGMAGVQPGATQIVPRSVDGWTAGFPTAWVADTGRDAMIAVKMNDAPLPAAHGFPARLIVPGLYGYVSATKWLAELELTTLEGFDAYWVPRGWAKEAPILTQSRIDVPRSNATVQAGRVAVAGVAWAPDRGIGAVEVAVDDGPWQRATLATALAPETWVQWRFAWDATPGGHTLSVRATDGTGEVQTATVTSPAPDGARGHHAIRVTVA